MLDKHSLHKTLGRPSAILLGSRYSVSFVLPLFQAWIMRQRENKNEGL